MCVSDVDCSWSGTSHRRPRFTKYTHISLTIKIRFSLSQYSLKTYAQTHTQTAWARATHLHFSSQSLSALSPAHKTTQQLTHKQTHLKWDKIRAVNAQQSWTLWVWDPHYPKFLILDPTSHLAQSILFDFAENSQTHWSRDQHMFSANVRSLLKNKGKILFTFLS